MNIVDTLHRRKYELMLLALVQHLFAGIFLSDMDFYTRVVWPANMLILGLGSAFVFSGTVRWKRWTRNGLYLIVVALPVGIPFLGHYPWYFQLLNVLYVIYFIFIFTEVLTFLVKPGYINTDIISAAACGYLLLIEISVFLLQYFEYRDPLSFAGINTSSPANVFTDLVYFCCITFTSIGFGDIIPKSHTTKLITSFIGIAGQFYTVVLVGILISKFSSGSK